jgi:hypothetical protein
LSGKVATLVTICPQIPLKSLFSGGAVMLPYQIIETDEGLAAVETPTDATPEEVAVTHGGILIDPGPYKTFDEAYDAILALQEEEDDL